MKGARHRVGVAPVPRWAGVALSVVAIWVTGGGAVLAQDQYTLLITGASGGAAYAARYDEWRSRLVTALRNVPGFDDQHLIVLAETPGPGVGRASRDGVRDAVDRLSERMDDEAVLYVVLMGHGSFDGIDAKFNLVGPDLEAREWSAWLDRVPGRVVVVNTTSVSSPFIERLSGRRRTIVTATRSGRERNETIFGGYFVDAFTGEDADLNKDGRVSVWEAFEFARIEVAREFETSNLIATEHALLDDNGDGEGSTELAEATDGALARTMFLAGDPTMAAAIATDDEELRALLLQKADVERRIEELRVLRDQIDQDRYENELEELLVELALTNREIAARTGVNE